MSAINTKKKDEKETCQWGLQKVETPDRKSHVWFHVDTTRYTMDTTRPTLSGTTADIAWCIHQPTMKRFVIKQIRDSFQTKQHACRFAREVGILSQIVLHPNIMQLHTVIEPKLPFKQLSLVMDSMDLDLNLFLTKMTVTLSHTKVILYQLLLALSHLHESNVVHRDVKPSNILLDAKCNVKLADFGMARVLPGSNNEAESGETMTQYVVTRMYRAPELLCANSNYDSKVDIWSAGYIFLRMILGKKDELWLGPSQFQNQTESHQLIEIFKILGTPSPQDLNSVITNPHAKKHIQTWKIYPKQEWKTIGISDQSIIALLEGMLAFDPKKRFSAQEALSQSFFDSVRSQYKVNSVPNKLTSDYTYTSSFKKWKLYYGDVFWQMLLSFYPNDSSTHTRYQQWITQEQQKAVKSVNTHKSDEQAK